MFHSILTHAFVLWLSFLWKVHACTHPEFFFSKRGQDLVLPKFIFIIPLCHYNVLIVKLIMPFKKNLNASPLRFRTSIYMYMYTKCLGNIESAFNLYIHIFTLFPYMNMQNSKKVQFCVNLIKTFFIFS